MANIAWKTEQIDVLIEKHSKHCPCSYCAGDFKLHFGLNLPKAKHGWKVIKIFRWYIRWVGFRVVASFSPRDTLIQELKKSFKDSANFNINQQTHGGQSVSQPAPNCEDATSPC